MSLTKCTAAGILIALAAMSSSSAYGAKRTAAKLPDDMQLAATPGKAIYTAKSGQYAEGQFAVFVPKAYCRQSTPIPLVISSHGSGGNGPAEIGEWEGPAEKYGFLVVLSFLCQCHGGRFAAGNFRAIRHDVRRARRDRLPRLRLVQR